MAEQTLSSAARDVELNISTRVLALRSERGMTQGQLAEAAGVTKGYMSKIENARIVPPIGTLVRIAHALQTDVAAFLQPVNDPFEDVVSVVRASERQPAVRGASAFGYDYISLAHQKRDKRMEPFIFSFPEVQKEVFFEHEGEEFLFILSGRVEWEMLIDGEPRVWVLEEGDSLYFESRIPHRGRGLGPGARALIVIHTPD
tara:strand:+ start:1264 stop:1866 length:603 start_codon:yes stop_codon:yes gene_type:complete